MFLSLNVFEYAGTVACMGRSGDVQEESFLSFHLMGPGIELGSSGSVASMSLLPVLYAILRKKGDCSP